MKNFKLLFLFVILSALSISGFAQSGFSGKVVEVLDGKTVVVELHTKTKITAQLQFIEVPEPEQGLHDVVISHLKTLVLGKYVSFKPRGITSQKSIVQLFADNIDISRQMIRDGAAWHAVLEYSGQDADERAVYQSTEKLAQKEKRGVWSNENILTAWEFREAREEQKKLEERARLEKIKLDNERKANERANNKVETPQNKTQTNLEMWADVSDHGMLTSNLDLLAQAESQPNASEPFIGQDPANQRSYIATPISALELKYKNDELNILGMLIYYYKTDGVDLKEKYYVLGLQSVAPSEKFADARVLTIMADNKKIVSYGANRLVEQVPAGVQEKLYYGITADDLDKIKNAKNLKVSLGNYSGTIKGAFFKKIQVLIAKLQ